LMMTLLTAFMMNANATYYMAGNGSATNNWCCGINWQADGCEMTNGAYSAKVPAGTYEFKVTEGNWQVSYGVSSVDASNSTPGYGGEDNVKFTVDSEANINVTFDGIYIVLTSDVPFTTPISSWTIAGVSGLMGSNWDPSDTNNDMTLQNTNYVLVKKGVDLKAGSYDYKAMANHAWSIKEVPASGNQTLTISVDGTYDVTFSMNQTGTTLTASADLVFYGTIGTSSTQSDYLHFVSLKGNGTVRLDKVAVVGDAKSLTATFEYSRNRKAWTEYTWNVTQGDAIALENANDTVWFRAKGTNGKNNELSKSEQFFRFFFGKDDSIAAGGNIMSLYDATCQQNTMTAYGFNMLFQNATQLVSAPKLPATVLAKGCYASIFSGCTSLVTAPALPATTLEESCYSQMFNNCTSLTTAPKLEAATLKLNCYIFMFCGCTALTQAPELKATTLANSCYQSMFQNCTSLQVDTCTGSCDGAKLEIPSTGAKNWNINMFDGCHVYDNVKLGGHYCVSEWQGPRDMQFLSTSIEQSYDGQSHTASVQMIVPDKAQFSTSADGNNWSNWTEKSSVEILSTDKTDQTLYVKIKPVSAKEADYNPAEDTLVLNITPATLTVTGTTAAEKVYDGTTDAEVTAGTLEGVVGNDEVNIESATGAFADKNAGEYKEVTVTYTLSGNDAANYSIEEGQTTANITPREITLQSADVGKKYDGKALTAYSKDSGTVITDVNASYVAGECLSYAFTGSQLAVGSSPSTFMAGSNDSTNVNNYDVTSLYGTLTVIPTDTLISITADSDSKIYDGTPLADAGYTVSGTLGAGDYVSDVVNEGSITNAGTVPNKVNGYKIFNNVGEDVTSFYSNVKTVDGILTVKYLNEDPITVSVISDSKKYDGKALNIGYTYSDKLLDGDVLGVTFNVDYRVDAGFDTVNITNVRIMRGDLDVTGGYLIDTLIPGYIEVLPRTIVLTSASVTRSYDGTALTASDVTIGGDGLAKGDGIDFNVTGSQTRIGSSDNTFSYSFKPGTRSSNYIVESGFGTLTVNPISLVPVTVTVSKLSKKYDGTPLASEYTSTAELQEGDILEVMLSADSRTDAGKDDVCVGNIRIMRGMQDVTEGYTFGQIVSGSIEIKPRTLVLTSGSASKLFDGTALTDTTFTIDGDGLAKGEGLAVDFTGAQTKVGSSDNAFAYTFKPGTKAGNYDVETAFGVLEVENSVSPAITGNYDKWTIVLETVALESALAKLGVNATVKAENVRWFKVSGSDADAVDMYTGIHTGNDSATNPATGLTHSETVVMDGQYYAVVYVPEAESVMGISYFMTNVVLMDGKLSPVHMHGADSDGSLGYDLNGRPVNDGYDGITIYRNGQKIYR